MVVPVRLPDQLCISGHTMIPVVDQWRESEWRPLSGRMVAVPVDRMPEVAIDEIEKAQPMVSDLLGVGDQTIAPEALVGTLGLRPLTDVEIGDPEARISSPVACEHIGNARPRRAAD